MTTVRWRIHLASPPEDVHRLLSTAEGRARFWAESAEERDGAIEFLFPDGERWRGKLLANEPPHVFELRYVGGTRARFALDPDGAGGTDVTLTDDGVPDEWEAEVRAGWVSVLLALKAAADFGADVRNHDPRRSWAQGYADN